MKKIFSNFVINDIVKYLNIRFQFFGAPKVCDIKSENVCISPSYTKYNTEVTKLDEKLHWKFEHKKEILYPETFVTILKNGRVWGNNGIVITGKNVLFFDVSREFHDKAEHLSIFRYRDFAKPKYFDATVAVIGASGAQTYYHWMMDIVPRVDLLIKSGNFTSIEYFVTNYTGISFQKELLKKLNISEDKIIASNDFERFHIQAKTLIVPSLVTPNDSPSEDVCLFLKHLFINDLSTVKPEKCIYVQRKNGRKIINEQELIAFLINKGFEVIQAENLTVAQQASVFSQARFVVAPHGAGLTNIVFCQRDCKIIDIFSPEWINGCYWVLSNQLNLKYSYLIGEGPTTTIFGKNTDITISMEKFNKLFNIMENKQ